MEQNSANNSSESGSSFRYKWRVLLLLALAELLAMATWFSASAVLPALTDSWELNEAGQAWLTMTVQIGFVIGALGSAILNLADRIPSASILRRFSYSRRAGHCAHSTDCEISAACSGPCDS